MKKTIVTILIVGMVLLAGVAGGTAVMFMHFAGISVQAASSTTSLRPAPQGQRQRSTSSIFRPSMGSRATR
jgi:flagellar basal body-associated protein FliL